MKGLFEFLFPHRDLECYMKLTVIQVPEMLLGRVASKFILYEIVFIDVERPLTFCIHSSYPTMNSSLDVKIPSSAVASVRGSGASNFSDIRQVSHLDIFRDSLKKL